MRFVLAIGVIVTLSACAGTGVSSASQEREALRAQCEARNGTLIPTGSPTGNVATDYVCRIRDGGSNFPPA
jgi:hypothetical protein